MTTWNNMISSTKWTLHYNDGTFQVTDHPKGYPALVDMFNAPRFPTYVLPNPQRQIRKWLGEEAAKAFLSSMVCGRAHLKDEMTAAEVMTAIREEIIECLTDISRDAEGRQAAKPWFGKRLTWKDAQ